MNLVNKKNGELSIDLSKSAWGLPYFTSLTPIIIWNSKEAENVNAQKQFIDHLVILPLFFLLVVTLMTHSVVISTDLSPPPSLPFALYLAVSLETSLSSGFPLLVLNLWTMGWISCKNACSLPGIPVSSICLMLVLSSVSQCCLSSLF